MDFEMKLNTAKLISIGLLAASGLGAKAATITLATPGDAGTFASASTLSLNDAGFVLGVGNPNLTNSSTSAIKTFFDDFVFTISSGMNLSLAVLPVNVSNFSESLYATTAISPFTAVGTNPFALAPIFTSTTTATSWNNLAAGTYTLQYSGTLANATTKFGINVPTVGSYSSLVTLTPVPEAETYAMLLAGLGLIGAAVKRRKAIKS
jgi:hypothetical protein